LLDLVQQSTRERPAPRAAELLGSDGDSTSGDDDLVPPILSRIDDCADIDAGPALTGADMAEDLGPAAGLPAFAGTNAEPEIKGPGTAELKPLDNCTAAFEAEAEFLPADLGDVLWVFAFVVFLAFSWTVIRMVGPLKAALGMEYDPLLCLLFTGMT